MPYEVYYADGCAGIVPQHVCDPCADVETGRVRAVAFIHDDYFATLNADPTDSALWTAGIVALDIIIIPETNGSFDGGTPKEGTGYGDSPTKYMGSEFVLNYKDPNYIDNCDFYNGIQRSTLYHVAYKTETQIHLSEKTVTVLPKAPISESLDDQVVWDVTVKFNQFDTPCPHNVPDGIFTCFELVQV